MKKNVDRVKKIIADNLSVEVEKILPESRLAEDLGADSLDTVELVMKMEEEFAIEISDSDAEKLSTFQDILEFINAQSTNQKAKKESAPNSVD